MKYSLGTLSTATIHPQILAWRQIFNRSDSSLTSQLWLYFRSRISADEAAAALVDRCRKAGISWPGRTVTADSGAHRLAKSLGSVLIVASEQTTESLTTFDLASRRTVTWLNDLVIEPLMIPLLVIVRQEFGAGISQRSLAA